MNMIGKFIDVVFEILKYVIALLFSVLVILVFLQVFNRFVLQDSLTWSTELANYAMMWITLLGSAVLARNKGHMAINNLLDALNGAAKTALTVVSFLLQMLFLVAWIYGCMVFLPTVAGQKSPVLQLNMAAVNSVFLITGVLMLLAMVDFWVVRRGRLEAYSEEDELIRRMREENALPDGEG